MSPRKKPRPSSHQYERSEHSRANITCYDCHQPGDGQESYDHFNFPSGSRSHFVELPGLPPHRVRAIRSESACTAGLGRRQRVVRDVSRARGVGRAAPPRRRGPPAQPARAPRGRSRDRDRMPGLPRNRPAEPRRVDRKLHGMPLATLHLHRTSSRAADLRPMPHGSRTMRR